jgi:hypothetical protein
MSRTEQRAKLSPGLLGVRSLAQAGDEFVVSVSAEGGSEQPGEASAIPIPSLEVDLDWTSTPGAEAVLAQQQMLFKKGAATARGFRPSNWSYDPNTQESDPRPDPLSVTIRKQVQALTVQSTLPAGETNHASVLTKTHARVAEIQAAQQALAASLAEIIDNILCTQRFAARRQA